MIYLNISVSHRAMGGEIWKTELDDGTEVYRGKFPFYGAARALLDRGISPDEEIHVRHKSTGTVSMKSTVGEAAKWIVAESKKGGIAVVKWSPHAQAEESDE